MCEKEVIIRDFAYSNDDPRHKGVFEGTHAVRSDDHDNSDELDPWSSVDMGGSRVTTTKDDDGNTSTILGKAKALYDFEAENPTELSFDENDILYITYKQCDGWLVGYKGNQVGLVPENYVEFIN